MSILGYSTSYFLPEYWSSTPLYGEQIVALLDEVLSLNYSRADGLAGVYYDIANKYSNTPDLSVGALEELIDESGYSYIRELLGNDGPSLVILAYLLPMIHQYKGTKTGLELVLNMLRKNVNTLDYGVYGSPVISNGFVSSFSVNDYIYFKGLQLDEFSFEINTKIITGELGKSQCILSSDNYGISLSVSPQGALVLSLGSDKLSWNVVDGATSSSTLEKDSTYYVKFSFDGYKYVVQISEDGATYQEFISVESNDFLEIHSGKLFMGVNGSTKTVTNPFLGSISRDHTHVSIKNIDVIEWFEEFPVKEENTFRVTTDLDTNTINENFFSNFFKFTSRYIYPTLSSLSANLAFETNITFIPQVCQKVTFISSGIYGMMEPFQVKEEDNESQWQDFLVKIGNSGNTEIFDTVIEDTD